NSEFYVKTPYVLDNYKLKLFSITGKLLLEQSLKSDFTKVEISDLSKGIYIYKIEGSGEIVKTDKLFVL
ncbi:MAG TPA: T9SS type A sorting domain-containing protein, partial [Flavobacteriales bacterium]|nr:T9SS type A sorting domain-containing protein [Flavobacteriales bacterium]